MDTVVKSDSIEDGVEVPTGTVNEVLPAGNVLPVSFNGVSAVVAGTSGSGVVPITVVASGASVVKSDLLIDGVSVVTTLDKLGLSLSVVSGMSLDVVASEALAVVVTRDPSVVVSISVMPSLVVVAAEAVVGASVAFGVVV